MVVEWCAQGCLVGHRRSPGLRPHANRPSGRCAPRLRGWCFVGRTSFEMLFLVTSICPVPRAPPRTVPRPTCTNEFTTSSLSLSQDEADKWVPCTKLGRLVQQGKIKTLEHIYLFSIPIKEYQIVEHFIGPALTDEAGRLGY